MTNFTPSTRVLVTGANGHVAQHVVTQLLALPHEQRPKVRATVRSEASTAALISEFPDSVTDGFLEIVLLPISPSQVHSMWLFKTVPTSPILLLPLW